MNKLIWSTLCLLFISLSAFSQTRAKKKSDDFVAGDVVIFEDSLKGETLGEFPSKWDLKSGLVEVMEMDGQKVIGFVDSRPTILPLMDKETFLPDHFTLEFDVYFHNKGNEGYYVEYDNRKMSTRISNASIKYGGTLNRAKNNKRRVGWQHVAISFNKRAYKVYLDGERLVNVPNIQKVPTNFSIKALTHGSSSDRFAIVKNVRLAKGGMPLYDRLLSEGRFVTNDIQFEYDKAILKPSSQKIIDQVATMLKAHPDIQLSIEGHTDSDGTETYNQELSQKRATAVKAALVKKGIAKERLRSKGMGESKPVANNATEEGKAKNRRVEFVLINP